MSVLADRSAGTGVGRPVVLGALGKAAEAVTLLLLAVVVPRVLGPGTYGVFATALTVVTLGSLAMTLGGPTLMSRFVPTAEPADRPALARALTLRLARGRGAQLVGVAAAGWLLAQVRPDVFPPLLTAVVVAALAVNVTATLALQVGLGMGRTLAWSLRYPAHNAVLVAGVVVLHDGRDVARPALAILLAALTALAIGVVAGWPVLSRRTAPVALPAGAIRFGVIAAAGGALGQVAHRGGILLVAVLGGSTAQTGFAALSLGVALAATYAVVQLFTVSLPGLAERGAADRPASEATLRRLAEGLVAILLPAALVGAVVLDRAVPLVFGDDYGPAAAAFGPALALVVMAPLNAMVVQVAALRLRPTAAMWCALAGVLAVAVAGVAAVPAWGAVGGTLAAMVGTVVSGVVALLVLPGAVGRRLAWSSLLGAVLVVVVAVVA